MAGISLLTKPGIKVGIPLGRTGRIVLVPLGLAKPAGLNVIVSAVRNVKSPGPDGDFVAGLGDLARVVILGEAPRSG